MTRRTPNRNAATGAAQNAPPRDILRRLRKPETEISLDLTEREEMLG
jgi:hypothetical protein